MTVLTPRDQALSLVRRMAHQCGAEPEDVMAHTRKPAADLARIKVYLALADDHRWSVTRIARFFGRDPGAIHHSLRRARERGVSAPRPATEIAKTAAKLEELEDLRAMLRRLTGEELSYRLRERLGLPAWQAVALAILVEGYPRTLNHETFIELYEAARERMAVGQGGEVDSVFIKTATSRIRAAFRDQGLGDPIASIRPFGLRLSDAMAPWFEANFGAPHGVSARRAA